MTIWNIDEKLLDFLRSRQGMALSELDITAPLRISHGTFSAVRRRLIDEGRLSCSRVGRRLLFRVIEAADGQPPVPVQTPIVPPQTPAVPPAPASPVAAPPSAAIAPPSAEAAPPDGTAADTAEPAPRITGWFPSVDDWTEILIQRLGDVGVDQIDDETYTVTIMATFEEQPYTVRESAGGVEIS